MNFDLNDEQQEIRTTARSLLAVRGNELDWKELCELGWPGIAVAEKDGGLGLGLVELAILAEELGRACGGAPFLGSVLASLVIGKAGSESQREHWLPQLVGGEMLGALAIRNEPSLIPDAAPGRLLVLANGDGTAELFPGGPVEAVDAVDLRRRHGLFDDPGGEGDHLDVDPGAAIAAAMVVVAAELVGLCRRALEATVAYVRDRRQFDVPIGSFQAVQHTAAQMLRDTEAAAIATYYAAWIGDNRSDGFETAASMAKALASDAGRSVTASAIQLHGGIGFTWEEDLHWLFKRAQVGAIYLGGSGAHRAGVARRLAASASK